MVKDIKYIIKRILIGVGVVLVLSFLRGNLLIGANALEPVNVTPNGMCWDDGVNPTNCFIAPTQYSFIDRDFYGNTFGSDGDISRFIWRYYGSNIGGKYYDIDLLFYYGANTSFLDSNRGYIQNSDYNIFSCSIDNTRWGVTDSTSSNAPAIGTATVHCNNVYLSDDYFRFYVMDGKKAYNVTYAVSKATLTPTSQQALIDSQNENTEKEIESQKVCNFIDKNSIGTDNSFLGSSGQVNNNSNFGITKYISINSTNELKIKQVNNSYLLNFCFYNVNKDLISCQTQQNLSVDSIITIPSNSSFVRFSIEKSTNKPQFELCKNGNQAIVDSNQELNNTLNNSSTDDPNSDINSMNSKTASNNSITQLLTLPITLFQNVLNNINGSCSAYSLGSLYGTTLTLPCINLENILGSTLWGVIDVLISGLFILSFRKKMVDIFNHMSSLNDRGNELE